MNTNYAALALVVDRSGSMIHVPDVKGSIKQFIDEQKNNQGKASLTVAQFDDRYELVYDFKDIREVDGEKFAKEYCPRGSTALLDAIGRTTIDLTQRLEGMPEADRPKRVVVAVITDGLENASREFNLKQIREIIKEKEGLGWDFMFMGATLDTIEVAKNMGFSGDKTAVYETSCFKSCMSSINEQVTKARLNKEVKITQEEREKLAGANKSS